MKGEPDDEPIRRLGLFGGGGVRYCNNQIMDVDFTI